jgi:hypothetical protein
MRDRWVSARRQEGHRRLRWLLAVAVVAALCAAGFGVVRSPLLAVETVQVSGATHETEAQVIAASGLGAHPPMLGLDTAAVTRRIDALPWVSSVRVATRWPSTVTVDVAERSAVAVVALDVVGPTAVAAVAAGAPTVLVDDTGRVLAPSNGLVPGLPVIVTSVAPGAPGQWLAGTTPQAATPGTTTPTDALLQLAADLPAPLSASVVSLSVAPDGSLEGEVSPPVALSAQQQTGAKSADSMTPQIPVNFGDSTDLPAKILSLQTAMSQIDLSDVTEIDVSDSQSLDLRGDPKPATLSTTAGG